MIRLLSNVVRLGLLTLFLLSDCLIGASATAAQLTLNWTDNSNNEDGFKIKRNPGPTGTLTFQQIATTGVNEASYVDSSVTNGTYCYRVYAYNSAGDSNYAEACGAVTQSTTYLLTITKAGTGSGTVTSNPTGINCGGDCSEAYSSGRVVTLTATPASGSTFAGWSGDSACSDGVVTLSTNRACAATFDLLSQNMVLSFTLINADTDQPIASFDPLQNGALLNFATLPTRNLNIRANTNPTTVGSVRFNLDNGTVTLTENLIPYALASDNNGNYNAWTPSLGSHTLTAVAYTGSNLGGTAGPPLTLSFTVVNQSAPPPPSTYLLTVTKAGPGTGTVTSDPAGITCGSNCTETYTSDAAVMLTATPASGSTFAGWSGDSDCSNGSVTMSVAKTCTATFNLAPPSAGGLEAAYSFNTGSGTTVTDDSGKGNTGTISGATWTTAGKFGAALAFDGVDDRVTIPDAASLDLGGAGTLEAWVKLDTLGRWHGVIAKGSANDNNAHNYGLEITTTNTVTCTLGNGASHQRFNSTLTLSTGQFTHLACTWTGSTVSLYVNGALHLSTAQTLTPAGNTTPLFLGQYGGNVDRLDGIIDNVRIYSRALTASEISADMNTSVSSTTPTATALLAMSSPQLAVKIGVFRPSTSKWYLDVNGNGVLDDCSIGGCLPLGQQDDPPVVGDWGSGSAARLGVFNPTTGQWDLVLNSSSNLDSCTEEDCVGSFGLSGDRRVVGDWSGTGQEQIGVFDPETGMWELDLNGNGTFDGCEIDACLGPFGQQGDLPVVGKW